VVAALVATGCDAEGVASREFGESGPQSVIGADLDDPGRGERRQKQREQQKSAHSRMQAEVRPGGKTQ
jgi:hypothetical protein